MNSKSGIVTGVNGNLVNVHFNESVMKNEVGYVITGSVKLKGEVIRVTGSVASLQIYEMTEGIKVGDAVEFTSSLLSVSLGPGLLKSVFDGLQNPLNNLAEKCGFFLERGVYINAIENDEWDFTPSVKEGDILSGGSVIGSVPEGLFTHKIFTPFTLNGKWKVIFIKEKGRYRAYDEICVIENEKKEKKSLSMVIEQPVKIPIKGYAERLMPRDTMVTKIRLIDTFLPVAKGGTYCIPGPFGAGKTVLQHLTSKNADVDIVIIAACGERAGEVVEVLKEFPELTDPKTGRSLMERTIIICNTSSMPVAAREASVYTAVTMAEYYRNMGLDVLLLADSTSRWAQAMREMSGRLEEIPGDEAFPAYLESRIAEFYERAGLVRLSDKSFGSVTIGGTVSPAGGNFDEPVTQATLKVVGAFHGLSRERSDARKYPAIDPLDSWSKYDGIIDKKDVSDVYFYVTKSAEVAQMMKVVGEEGTSLDDYIVYQKGELVDSVYLQQNSFDPVDAAVSVERQRRTFYILKDIVDSSYNLKDKDDARAFFNEVRQRFLDYNGSEENSSEFSKREADLKSFFGSRLR
ncbi:MAG TPA: V-type ATP synthase subunit A [Candidatus Ornithospirochaeta avicola]|uniref:V-type ATP synthase alpha chain n=1 Tax=Candidatus Ornithospirochaeta avicola TaxID=2840896 RepID=A0A9D1PRN8_9SPIO|nr:V-type ATP synthase subunit A [Candidatus Ornithospirochaeta avicola]